MLNDASLIIPAKNEAPSLASLLPRIREELPNLKEIIVVNDGSSDNTSNICEENQVVMIKHLHSRGNGACIKAGVRKATGKYVCFMDADGQHDPASIGRLLDRLCREDLDMVVGARKSSAQAGFFRLMANKFYNWFASKITEYPILDLTSGLRVAVKEKFGEFLYLLPNGFSYPTTSTMAFLRSGYQVEYIFENISKDRVGSSHIKPIKDGMRFLIIIFKIGTLYSPLKVFTPISFSLFLVSFFYYIFTFITKNTLTNMSVILFTSSLTIFLIGLVSEQLNSLMYMKSKK